MSFEEEEVAAPARVQLWQNLFQACRQRWLWHGCGNKGSFTRTRQHFLVKRRANDGTKSFFLLLTDFGKSFAKCRCLPWGRDACQVSPLAPIGGLELLPTRLSSSTNWPAFNVVDRRSSSNFFGKGQPFPDVSYWPFRRRCKSHPMSLENTPSPMSG